MTYFLCIILFVIGLYCVLVKKNLIKIIIGIGIMEYAVNLMFIVAGYKTDGQAPIHLPGYGKIAMVDPLPQALILTSIVIGLAVMALLVAIALRIYERYGTFDVTKIRRLRG